MVASTQLLASWELRHCLALRPLGAEEGNVGINMSDKRRRYRKIKDDKRPMGGNGSRFSELEIQPKILLKTKADTKPDNEFSANVEAAGVSLQVPQKTIIVTRSEAAQSPAPSPNTTKEQQSGAEGAAAAAQQQQIIEPVPQMTRPATIISSTGFINSGSKKLLMKSNTDFLVVAVIGTQGVGKSTVLNLLANEQPDYDYYRKIFVEEDSIFPTKLKLHKCSARSRTESTHMFITSDRMILLDTPPVLCNSYKKDLTTNELDDLRNIITFLSVCHLVIVVQDDYFNMSFISLLQFAELMKPTEDAKPFARDYFPNLLFIQNRAKRHDFDPAHKASMDQLLKAFFKDSQMRIFRGQAVDLQQQQRQKKSRVPEAERVVNSFLLPDFKSDAATSFHGSLADIVAELRALVFMTPRNQIYAGPTELTEVMWFEMLTKVSQNTQHFFFNTYEHIHRKHLEVGGAVEVSGIHRRDVLDALRD